MRRYVLDRHLGDVANHLMLAGEIGEIGLLGIFVPFAGEDTAPAEVLDDRARVPSVFLGGNFVPVDPLLENRRRLENHNPARRNWNLCSGFRIATDTLALLAHDKGAERR